MRYAHLNVCDTSHCSESGPRTLCGAMSFRYVVVLYTAIHVYSNVNDEQSHEWTWIILRHVCAYDLDTARTFGVMGGRTRSIIMVIIMVSRSRGRIILHVGTPYVNLGGSGVNNKRNSSTRAIVIIMMMMMEKCISCTR